VHLLRDTPLLVIEHPRLFCQRPVSSTSFHGVRCFRWFAHSPGCITLRMVGVHGFPPLPRVAAGRTGECKQTPIYPAPTPVSPVCG